MAESRHYPRPPITEAVVELRYEGQLNVRETERVRDRFKPRYPTVEQLQMVEVLFGEGGTATPKFVPAGFKMTDKNALDVLMIKTNALGTIRLAPYERWETLKGRAEENWEVLEKVLNTRKRVVRIGARFINRIDIPSDLLGSKDVGEFFPTHIGFTRTSLRKSATLPSGSRQPMPARARNSLFGALSLTNRHCSNTPRFRWIRMPISTLRYPNGLTRCGRWPISCAKRKTTSSRTASATTFGHSSNEPPGTRC
jgi:hypothetical protein